MRSIPSSLRATFTALARILWQQIRQASVKIWALPRRCTRALQQPSLQYRIALFLTTILVFLLGWSLFLSTLPHTPLALLGHG